MTSGGSHLLLSPPSPRTQTSHQPTRLAEAGGAGARRIPRPSRLPGKRIPAARCQAPVPPSSHAQQVQEGCVFPGYHFSSTSPNTSYLQSTLCVYSLCMYQQSTARATSRVPASVATSGWTCPLGMPLSSTDHRRYLSKYLRADAEVFRCLFSTSTEDRSACKTGQEMISPSYFMKDF